MRAPGGNASVLEFREDVVNALSLTVLNGSLCSINTLFIWAT